VHVLKTMVGDLASPLLVGFLLVLAAAGLYRAGGRRSALWLAIIALCTTYLGSMTWVGDMLLGPLERAYPPLPLRSAPAVKYIVVLGSGYWPRDNIPISAALDADGLARIVEGVCWARRISSARLVVSGGAEDPLRSPARGYREMALQLGMEESSIVILDTPRDTRAEAAAITKLVGAEPFLLVTSAYHMPRAMRLMSAVGAKPVAAPTFQKVNAPGSFSWHRIIPSSEGLLKTERALHEYLGLFGGVFGVA
jgi:uncharacterized SAM-binding protein YcdF (DUF218 family)